MKSFLKSTAGAVGGGLMAAGAITGGAIAAVTGLTPLIAGAVGIGAGAKKGAAWGKSVFAKTEDVDKSIEETAKVTEKETVGGLNIEVLNSIYKEIVGIRTILGKSDPKSEEREKALDARTRHKELLAALMHGKKALPAPAEEKKDMSKWMALLPLAGLLGALGLSKLPGIIEKLPEYMEAIGEAIDNIQEFLADMDSFFSAVGLDFFGAGALLAGIRRGRSWRQRGVPTKAVKPKVRFNKGYRSPVSPKPKPRIVVRTPNYDDGRARDKGGRRTTGRTPWWRASTPNYDDGRARDKGGRRTTGRTPWWRASTPNYDDGRVRDRGGPRTGSRAHWSDRGGRGTFREEGGARSNWLKRFGSSAFRMGDARGGGQQLPADFEMPKTKIGRSWRQTLPRTAVPRLPLIDPLMIAQETMEGIGDVKARTPRLPFKPIAAAEKLFKGGVSGVGSGFNLANFLESRRTLDLTDFLDMADEQIDDTEPRKKLKAPRVRSTPAGMMAAIDRMLAGRAEATTARRPTGGSSSKVSSTLKKIMGGSGTTTTAPGTATSLVPEGARPPGAGGSSSQFGRWGPAIEKWLNSKPLLKKVLKSAGWLARGGAWLLTAYFLWRDITALTGMWFKKRRSGNKSPFMGDDPEDLAFRKGMWYLIGTYGSAAIGAVAGAAILGGVLGPMLGGTAGAILGGTAAWLAGDALWRWLLGDPLESFDYNANTEEMARRRNAYVDKFNEPDRGLAAKNKHRLKLAPGSEGALSDYAKKMLQMKENIGGGTRIIYAEGPQYDNTMYYISSSVDNSSASSSVMQSRAEFYGNTTPRISSSPMANRFKRFP